MAMTRVVHVFETQCIYYCLEAGVAAHVCVDFTAIVYSRCWPATATKHNVRKSAQVGDPYNQVGGAGREEE